MENLSCEHICFEYSNIFCVKDSKEMVCLPTVEQDTEEDASQHHHCSIWDCHKPMSLSPPSSFLTAIINKSFSM